MSLGRALVKIILLLLRIRQLLKAKGLISPLHDVADADGRVV